MWYPGARESFLQAFDTLALSHLGATKHNMHGKRQESMFSRQGFLIADFYYKARALQN